MHNFFRKWRGLSMMDKGRLSFLILLIFALVMVLVILFGSGPPITPAPQ